MGLSLRVNGDAYCSIQVVLLHHRHSITNDQNSHLQCAIKNDSNIFDHKLLSYDKMSLMTLASSTMVEGINV